MTSLQLFPSAEHNPSVPKEWGSGKYKEDVNVYIPGPPTWQYSGEPTDQFYTLTQLKLSDVRTNDELVPRPQVDTMGDKLIDHDFPAEHPYSSHIPRYAIFPTFDSTEDPKRGVKARREMPINAEMPATAYDVAVIQKTKGHGLRRETQVIPKESEKRALEWAGEDGFHQLVKSHGGRRQYYPTPQKVVVPNLNANRWESMKLSDRAANTLRNIERDHWQSHYDRQHTGIGPSNPNKLDNLEDKMAFYEATGLDDDNLYPRSVNTFDPPRPLEGRIAKKIIPKPPLQKPATDDGTNKNYVRRMTEHETEEDRLWNGKEYINLPDTNSQTTKIRKSLRWKEINDESHPDPNIEKMEATIMSKVATPIPYPPSVRPTEKTEENYLKTTKDKQDHRFMEIEAQNRFKELELQKPSHDLTSLHYKMQHSRETEKPKTFYDHEGKYNEERAGLYRTSYLPERLAFSMNEKERSAPELMNTLHSHKDAENLPTRLNQEMKEAFKNSRTLNSSLPNLAGDMRESWQVLQPWQHVKEDNKNQLQPTQETARVRMQEKNLILKDSDTGSRFNTSKFLQENSLVPFARNEPLNVMSNDNQNLDNVRFASGGSKSQKSVSFSEEDTVAQSNGYGTSVRIISSPQRMRKYQLLERRPEPEEGEADTAQYKSTHALCNVEEEHIPEQKAPWLSLPPRASSVILPQESISKTALARKPRRRAYSSLDTEYNDEFGSYSTNVVPTNLRHSMSYNTSYGNQFPNYSNLDYKFDNRLLWQPGYGMPRPQTKLLAIQDSFNMSELRKKFHSTFCENNPDLRDNIIRGKRHTFNGLNAQNLRG